ncbi:MAG TPA: aminotransferase class I/II-fold pyridoxal phosphate-dependent enzyme, partial [Anseongella sp.]|nr:aminotransferase class I/II-fold pyridoxal phosphate-dependent enzyme [Anseongella sp.]
IGAFVSGEEYVVEYLRYNMRSQTFAKALPLPMVAGLLKRLELLQNHPEYKDRLWAIVGALQNGLREKGFDIGNTNSCVTPVFMKGSLHEALNMIVDLRENYHIFCSIVTYPVIPKGQLMLRLIPTAVHTLEDVKITLDAFSEVARKLNEGHYDSEKLAMV